MGDIDALVSYFCRERYYRHIQAVCEEVASKRGWEGKLVFWKCFGLGLEGNVNQAIRELEDLHRKRDFELAATEALLHFHSSVKLKDHGSIAELERNRDTYESRASDSSALLAASFCLHVGQFNQARKLVERVLTKNPMNIKACTLRGWVELLGASDSKGSRHDLRGSALQYFDQALNADRTGKKELNALMGKSYFYVTQGKFSEALEFLDQAVVSYQWFLPALVEKAKILLLMQNWELALETAERVLQQDENDIGSLQVVALYKLTHDNNPEESAETILQLTDAMDQFEPENAELWLRTAQPLARLAERNEDVLRNIMHLVERAKKKLPDSTSIVTEYAYELALMGKYDASFSAYEHASQLDESNGNALFGQIYCLVKRGDLEEAAQQLEFLSVLQDTIGRTAQVAFLDALLTWQRDHDKKKSLKLLNETVHLHVKSIQAKKTVSIIEHFMRLNPDFMIEIATEYLQHCGTEPIEVSEAPPQHLLNGIKLLEKVLKFVPSMLSVQLALARARFVSNNLEAAAKAVDHCIALNPSFSEAHLLNARIELYNDSFAAARSSLEEALSHNFEIRDSAEYLIVKARVLLGTGELDEARAVLEQALKLPGVRQDNGKVSIHDRVSVYIDLATVYIALKQMDQAKNIIRTARKLFPDEVRVIVADSELCLKRRDVKGALRLLNEVPPDSPAFFKAHLLKAEIFLTHRNDKDAYIRCYLQLTEHNPASHSFVLLGEAYIRVDQPDDAIGAFKEALKRNSKDAALAKRIGKVLVSTHDYTRAIDYYKSALRSSDSGTSRHALRYDLAELYYNLGKRSKASKELQSALQDIDPEGESKDSEFDSSKKVSATDLVAKVRALKLLAKVCDGSEDSEQVVDILNQARNAQSKLLSGMRSGDAASQQHKLEMASICILLATHCEQIEKDETQAVSFYNDALRYDSGNVQSMLALAKLHLRSGDLERAHAQLVTTLRVDEQNEEASMMLADLMFQRNEFSVSIFHYQQLLERNPANFEALAKLITLLFRAAELDSASRYFMLAEHKSPRVVHEPGFGFCKGLFNRFSNDVTAAISEFNKARRDVVWGPRALTQMIELYLNPDNQNLWEEEGSIVDGAANNIEAVRTAQKLIDELPDDNLEKGLLECYAMLSSKNRPDIEKAFQRLVELVQQNPDNVPCLLALSTALMMMKQVPKARNQLKRISKMQYNQEEHEAFEKCWLLLADIFISSGKYDLAQGLCKRCLQYNKSCSKAWEYMGVIMEKEASYADAAEHYEQAWRFQKMASASVGYKLAFNYLKAKRYVEAIDVANKVLKQFPEYPRIRKDILDKARHSIRA